ncbi:MAG: lysophospholipase [Bacteroidia bacterium]|nr:lysophospholipase [Bacteroidia bacterium]
MLHFEYNWKSYEGLNLYGQCWKPENGIKGVINIVHGLGEHSGRYQNWASLFVEKGYAVLAIDLRGHGKSEGRRGHSFSLDYLIQDIIVLQQQSEFLFPMLPKILYGQSLGGNLVLYYVLQKTPLLYGIIISSPWLRLAYDIKRNKTIIAKLFNTLLPVYRFSTNLDIENLCHDKEIISAYKNDTLVHDKISARMFIDVTRAGLWAIENAGLIYLPLLLMHGSCDKITSHLASIEFAGKSKNFTTLKIWEGLYHELHNEDQRTEVFQTIINWLSTL